LDPAPGYRVVWVRTCRSLPCGGAARSCSGFGVTLGPRTRTHISLRTFRDALCCFFLPVDCRLRGLLLQVQIQP
jgi:hypothetical protein